MAYNTLHFAPTARGTGDGSTAANAAEGFPGGNWSLLLMNHDYSASGLTAIFQNTGGYTLSQYAVESIFTSAGGVAPTYQTHSLALWAGDAEGNKIQPVNPGWKCAEGDLDDTGFVDLLFTAGRYLSSAIAVDFTCFKVTATLSTLHLLNGQHGLFSFCRFYLTATSYLSVFASLASGSRGMENCQVGLIAGDAWARLVTVNVTGLVTNLRITGRATGNAGTMYGLALSYNSFGTINGPICVVDCPGSGIVNLNTGTNACLLMTRVTVVNCGVGIATNATIPGGYSILVVGDSVVTGCAVGFAQEFGNVHLRNVVSRNAQTFSVAPVSDVSEPALFVTTESDEDLYSGAALGDYRVKATSSHWGKNRGAQDAPAVGGGGNLNSAFVNMLRDSAIDNGLEILNT